MLYLLNAPICHTPGLRYVTRSIELHEAQALAGDARKRGDITSAIGHEGTAQVLSLLLDQPIGVNRITMSYKPGDSAIALQLRERQPEGVILDAATVERIGYDLTLIETAPAPVCVVYGSVVRAVADPDVPSPRDIDVTFGGMDAHEARGLVERWMRERDVPDLAHLHIDLHPEATTYAPASYSGENVHTPAHYNVSLPYPGMGERSPCIVLAGGPKVVHRPVENIASLMRALGRDSPTLVAGKAIAGWVADNRDGLRVIMSPLRTGDADYKEGTLAGIHSGWRHVAPRHDARRREIVGHISGYIAGLGELIDALAGPVSIAAIARCAELSGCASVGSVSNDNRSQWGELVIHRKNGGPVWVASMRDVEMSLEGAVVFLVTGRVPA